MQAQSTPVTRSMIAKGAIINGSINATINGTTSWFKMDKDQMYLVSSDAISSTDPTVLSGAVTLAVTLAFMLSSIAYFTSKTKDKPPYFPKVFILCLKHSVYAFGLVTIAALLWQRFAGSIEVPALSAALITGLIAGIVGGIVNYETTKSVMKA